MTDKALRRLSRAALIEIIYTLQEQNAQLKGENTELRQTLDDKVLKVSAAGSIAEAALKLNGVFEAAQAAADQYLTSVRAAEETEQGKEAQKREACIDLDRAAHC